MRRSMQRMVALLLAVFIALAGAVVAMTVSPTTTGLIAPASAGDDDETDTTVAGGGGGGTGGEGTGTSPTGGVSTGLGGMATPVGDDDETDTTVAGGGGGGTGGEGTGTSPTGGVSTGSVAQPTPSRLSRHAVSSLTVAAASSSSLWRSPRWASAAWPYGVRGTRGWVAKRADHAYARIARVPDILRAPDGEGQASSCPRSDRNPRGPFGVGDGAGRASCSGGNRLQPIVKSILPTPRLMSCPNESRFRHRTLLLQSCRPCRASAVQNSAFAPASCALARVSMFYKLRNIAGS